MLAFQHIAMGMPTPRITSPRSVKIPVAVFFDERGLSQGTYAAECRVTDVDLKLDAPTVMSQGESQPVLSFAVLDVVVAHGRLAKDAVVHVCLVIDEERRDPVELVVAEPWRAPADGVEAADLVLRLDEELLAQSAAISSARATRTVPSYELRGIDPPMPAREVQRLYAASPNDLSIALKSREFVSDVCEYVVSDVRDTFSLNVATEYVARKLNGEGVAAKVGNIGQQIESCNHCIRKGTVCTHSGGPGEPCDQCVNDPSCTSAAPCVALSTVHFASDQATEQRAGMPIYNDRMEFEENFIAREQQPEGVAWYRRGGFGLLHFCKSMVAHVRNYRSASSKGTFCTTMLAAIGTSKNATLARRLCESVTTDVIFYKDRHSDEVAYLTVCPEVQGVLRDAERVKFEVVPEWIRPWSAMAAEHKLVRRPVHVASNTRGEFVFVDPETGVWMGDRHSPCRIRKLVEPRASKSPTGVAGVAGVAVLVVRPAQEEYALVADVEHERIIVIDHAESVGKKHTVEALDLGSSKIRAEGLDVFSMGTKTYLAFADVRELTVKLVELSVGKTAKRGTLLPELGWTGLVRPTDVAYHAGLNALLVADGRHVVALELSNGASRAAKPWACGFSKAYGIAVGASGNVLVTDAGAHKCHEFASDARPVAVWGSGAPGNADGDAAHAAFDEPLGASAEPGTMSWYVCCYGGAHESGSVCALTPTAFAVEYMSAVEQVYLATGYMPKKMDQSQRSARQLTFLDGIQCEFRGHRRARRRALHEDRPGLRHHRRVAGAVASAVRGARARRRRAVGRVADLRVRERGEGREGLRRFCPLQPLRHAHAAAVQWGQGQGHDERDRAPLPEPVLVAHGPVDAVPAGREGRRHG